MNSWPLDQALELRARPPGQILAQQKVFLRKHLRHAALSAFYSRFFRRSGIDIDQVSNTLDMSALPFTVRKDVEERPADFSVPSQFISDIADIAQTSGTSGRPLSVPFTQRDLERLAFNEAVAFFGAGIRPGNRVLLQVTLDRCFIAGLAYFSGCIKLGASAVRSGPVHPAAQWELIKEMRPSALVGVPAHLLATAMWGAENGMNLADSGVEVIIAIGEPVRRPDGSLLPLGARLKEMWNCILVSTYAATELQTCFCECTEGCGGHIHPELAIVEIVDENGLPVPDGEPGEVVVTPMGVEGMPLIRYRTGDVARLFGGQCKCGWNTPRLGPIEGRLSQRLKYRGTTLYPEMIFHSLQAEPRVRACYVEVRADYDLSDEVTVVVGIRPDESIDEEELLSVLQARLRVKPGVRIENVENVLKKMAEDGGRKPRKFFDYRGTI